MLNTIKDRISLLKLNFIISYHIQTAYFFDNMVSMASSFFYTLTLLLFIKIIYSNVPLFAGYTQNEMFLFILITQLDFYMDWMWSTNNILNLIDSVRSGELDLLLTKPVPTLFFITFRSISFINRFKDGIPAIILLCLLINFSSIHTDISKIIVAVLIFICGQISWHCFRFLFALPVFFLGQSSQIFIVSGSLGETNTIPFEGFTGKLRFLFTAIIPTLLTSQISVSVILGKSDPLLMLLISLGVTSVFLLLKRFGWIIALRNYSSASS